MKKIVILSLLILTVFISKPCTTFTFKTPDGKIFYGRNFDFPTGVGMVNINQKGLLKTSFVQAPEKNLQWRSKYGSISFNQIGREFSYGGMNEAGLVIEQMWLNEAKYPELDNRYGLTELQWIQYHLDKSASVQEVIDSDTLLRISPQSTATLHFLIADAGGNTAVIEYLNGKMHVYNNQTLPYTVLANCPYETSAEYTQLKGKTDGQAFSAWTQNSSGRFAKAVQMIENYTTQNPVDFAYLVLDSVSQQGSTQWSIVYNIEERKIHVKTEENKTIRELEMASFCFEPTCSDIQQADIHSALVFPLDFSTYSYEDNLNILNEVCANVEFLGSNMPEESRKATAGYAKSVVPSGPDND